MVLSARLSWVSFGILGRRKKTLDLCTQLLTLVPACLYLHGNLLVLMVLSYSVALDSVSLTGEFGLFSWLGCLIGQLVPLCSSWPLCASWFQIILPLGLQHSPQTLVFFPKHLQASCGCELSYLLPSHSFEQKRTSTLLPCHRGCQDISGKVTQAFSHIPILRNLTSGEWESCEWVLSNDS